MARQNKKISLALAKQDSTEVLSYVFDRLYVLRNQLLHGSSTWHGRLNRPQLKDGNKIMKDLVPIFITSDDGSQRSRLGGTQLSSSVQIDLPLRFY